MMARYTAADVIVVGLIGERGREVKEFIERILGRAGTRALGGGRHAGRLPAADAPARRLAGHGDRRIFPRPRPQRAADHGFADALRAGAARDRAGDRRGAGDQGLSAVGVRAPAAAGGARRQRRRRGPARSPPSTPCWPKATIRTTRSSMPRAPFSTATSCSSRRIAESGRYPAIDVEASVSRVMHDIVPRSAARAGAPLAADHCDLSSTTAT